jgi:hydrogenase nickel incorporation protein HypB
MCDTCGCTTTTEVTVLQHLLKSNQDVAAHNRSHFDQHGVLAVNIMSAPGAGKTTLIEATIKELRKQRPDEAVKIAVIEGDLETEYDAKRIRSCGVAAVQITTGSICHLDATMVHKALHDLNLDGLSYVFIENVGNLVCPANFDLGQHLNVVLLSIPEGDDKPAKYPVIFRNADFVLVTKSDLLPFFSEFNPTKIRTQLLELAKSVPMLEISAKNDTGVYLWLAWLEQQRSEFIQRLASLNDK